MARELKDVVATHVSIVKTAANGTKFLLTKSAEGKTGFEMNVSKFLVNKNNPEKIVYGIVYEPDTVDLQGDFMSAETIEKMAHDFMENYQNIDKNHDYVSQVGKVLESSIYPADIEIEGTVVKKGTWVLATRVNDDVWESVQKGDFTGFSIGGYAKEVVEDVEKQSGISRIVNVIKDVFGIEKDFNTQLKNNLNNDFWSVFYIFEDAVYSDWWNTMDSQEFKQKLLDSIMQMYEHVSGMTFEYVEKGAKMNEEQLKKLEELEKSLKEVTEKLEKSDTLKLDEKITSLEKQFTEVTNKMVEFVEKQSEVNVQIDKAFTERKSALGTGVIPVAKDEKKQEKAMGILGE